MTSQCKVRLKRTGGTGVGRAHDNAEQDLTGEKERLLHVLQAFQRLRLTLSIMHLKFCQPAAS